MRIFRWELGESVPFFPSRCLFFIVPIAPPRNRVLLAARTVRSNSRRLKLFHLLSDGHLDYGVRELECGVSGRRPNSMSRRMRTAPMAMAESATLKAG